MHLCIELPKICYYRGHPSNIIRKSATYIDVVYEVTVISSNILHPECEYVNWMLNPTMNLR